MPRPVRAIISDLLDLAAPDKNLQLDPDLGEPGALGHGFYVRARRLTEAALLLDDHGFGSEASPTRRSIFEHAISIRWLAASPQNAFDSFRLKHRTRFQTTLPHLVREWAMDPEDIADILGDPVPSNPENNLSPIAHMIGKHGDDNFLPMYYIESELSHPSLATARARTENRGDPDEAVGIYLHLATSAYDRLLTGRPLDAELEVLRVQLNDAIEATRAEYDTDNG